MAPREADARANGSARPGREDNGIDRSVRLATRARRVRVDREDLVASRAKHLDEQPPDETVADNEDAPTRHAPRAAEDARETG